MQIPLALPAIDHIAGRPQGEPWLQEHWWRLTEAQTEGFDSLTNLPLSSIQWGCD